MLIHVTTVYATTVINNIPIPPSAVNCVYNLNNTSQLLYSIDENNQSNPLQDSVLFTNNIHTDAVYTSKNTM